MDLAIVHEWLTNMGGSERLIVNFKELYPDAPIYTTIYNPEKLDKELRDIDVRTSFLQNKRGAKNHHQRYFPFMPMAFESFDLTQYDVVLSSSTSCAKGVITRPDTMHICYCNSPMRYGWEFYYQYIEHDVNSKIKKHLLKYLMNYMRLWDRLSSDRVDYFIANSENVARRIWKHYRRESVVIHPAVRTKLFNISETDEDYYLIVSRLVPYKKVDLAVKVFNELKLPLVIIGDGSERKKMEAYANDNIKFLGRQPDSVIEEYYSKCRAFLFPGEEDFGITPLEAQASGRPVIAYGKGGALETVLDGVTGVFFKEQTESDLKDAIKRFEKMSFDKNIIREHSQKFDEEIFKEKINNYVNECYEEFKNTKKWRVIK
ncbi:glycosyltransferase [Clostridium sp. 19966]|uniref:glycosyltransferase n=1 Tax=Clostridium sp. 19966 TaxID=2768166 RepID=UPI0028DDA63C|nr:glycosyltransferase [Clostridium sp. 19966]MDT8716163.1 glycosyltransferase [Clostridium sp. 19966]